MVKCRKCGARESGLGVQGNPYRPVRFTCTHRPVFKCQTKRAAVKEENCRRMNEMLCQWSADMLAHSFVFSGVAKFAYPHAGLSIGHAVKVRMPYRFVN